MIVYLYDELTRDYIAPPYECPKGIAGEFLIPAYCADVAPPPFNPAKQTCKWMDGAWLVADIAPTTPDPLTAQDKWRHYQATAGIARGVADLVAIECFKSGQAYPPEWLAYSDALADILRSASGDPTVPLPIQPMVPAGIKLV